MRASLAGALVLSLLASAGCGKIAGFEDFHVECSTAHPDCRSSGGTGGGSGSGGANGGTGAARGGSSAVGNGNGGGGGLAGVDGGMDGCDSSRPGPAMALVVRGPDQSAFWMDRTEVTVGQYAAFLKNHGSVDDPLCFDGPSFLPGCPGATGTPLDAGLNDDLPQACVDWCEAKAFCAWADKDLCKDSAAIPGSELLAKSEFYFACTEGDDGTVRYGCGSSSSCTKETCNGGPARVGHTLPVGARTDCVVSPPPQTCTIADLSGNVEEWTDACPSNTPGGECTVRGGSYDSSENDLQCDARKQYRRTTASPALGFRCCTHPP